MVLEHYKRVVEICLIGTFNTMRLAAADMSTLEPVNDEGQRGVVVNAASVAGYAGQIGQSPYASAKAGVIGLTLPAAPDLASLGVRVCTIAPGIFPTPPIGRAPCKGRQWQSG